MAARGAGKKAAPRKKGGYKMPPPMPTGEVLSDTQAKKKWRLGPSIGVGGFGEIYSACDDNSASTSNAAHPYVVKIEPHENGPLFVEKHFYSRNANKDDKIGKEWKEELCIRLIELYKNYTNLWDPTDSDYKVVSKRLEAWNEIADEMQADVNELKKKMSTLTSTYRRTHQKVKSDEEYIPTWFAYKHLDFLSVKYMDKYTTEEHASEHEEIAHDEIAKEGAIPDDTAQEEEIVEEEGPQDSSEEDSMPSTEQSDETVSQGSKKDKSVEESTPPNRKRSKEQMYYKRTNKRDEFDIYGEYIAHVLRNLDTYSMHCVQKVFSDVIFHARTGRYASIQQFKDQSHVDGPSESQTDEALQRQDMDETTSAVNSINMDHGN